MTKKVMKKMEYIKINLNPWRKKTGDCSTRAIAQALNCSWEGALTRQYNASMILKYDITSKEVMDKILTGHGFVKMKKPFKPNGKTYRVDEFREAVSESHFVAVLQVANHYVCVKDNAYIDSWNSGRKSVYGYWIKPTATQPQVIGEREKYDL